MLPVGDTGFATVFGDQSVSNIEPTAVEWVYDDGQIVWGVETTYNTRFFAPRSIIGNSTGVFQVKADEGGNESGELGGTIDDRPFGTDLQPLVLAAMSYANPSITLKTTITSAPRLCFPSLCIPRAQM